VIEIALYQPDIPQNTGAILRTAACLGFAVHIIEPAGFQWSLKSFRRAGMDYIDQVKITRHDSYAVFMGKIAPRRLVLATTSAPLGYTDFSFKPDDIVMFGRESAGVPENVHTDIKHRITIPLQPNARSLNIAISVAIITSEAMRQLKCQNHAL